MTVAEATESTGDVSAARRDDSLTRVVVSEFRRAIAHGPLPLPGSGRTFERWEGLGAVAARDLSAGRLYEGHTDALAILAEAGLGSRRAATYGVWAARSPQDPTIAAPAGDGWRLSGTKPFCSGVGIIDRALVTAEAPDGYRLFELDVTAAGITAVEGSWPAVGMLGSASLTVRFDSVRVAADDAVGGPGFYIGRPGFWFGAAGVAACWYGGGAGLVERLVDGLPGEPGEHVLTDLGRAVARIATMRRGLQSVAADVDADPLDGTGRARPRALELREAIHAACVDVLALVADAGGARPLGHDPAQARRAADLYVYLSQHHGPADAAQLGRLALEEGFSWH